jgi:transcriptional regulator with XRE-family HTH domain
MLTLSKFVSIKQIKGMIFVFYEQLKIACEKKQTTVTALLKSFNLSTANTGKWKNGGFPSVEVLLRISQYLNVSTDYLLGLTSNPKINK